MSLIRTIQLALKSLMLHKLRSGLTMLGIVFGVFSVIAMLAIGEGASQQAQSEVLSLGATNIIVRSIKPPQDAASSTQSSRVLTYGLKRTDYQILRDTLPTLITAVPIRETAMEFRHGPNAFNGRLVGCTRRYRSLNRLEMASGRFLSTYDNTGLRNVAVLSAGVVERLFPAEDPIGKSVLIGSTFYRVVGTVLPREASGSIGGSLSGQDYSNDIYIPIETLRVRVGDLIISRTSGSFSAEEVELDQITLQIDTVEHVLPTAEVVRETLAQTHTKAIDYSIIVPLELLKQADQIKNIFNVVLGSIAAISLVVGGIGIMNIMLATVTERTREIGIRRALGARRGDILRQFLTETIVLSGTGGIVGIILGLLTPMAFQGLKLFLDTFLLAGGSGSGGNSGIVALFSKMTPVVPVWSLALAFLISVGIGIVFGVYPARNAARMDPIEALRRQ
ncbi:ABC transporter permease [Calycomorphotria hydatis]|uniref:Macrolide export ATP-binding/permease protein MacB n=1 Tax=Calycomorphotria hydatis TaxID=2528027 RepID=A0A517T556_9PLAN|nr:ABC transporter permease [Calycomorphotria hydatis]QDT63507.1 Macrolide export ATP-binding/permease protein MacB [Calycomorphotria hydatis]